MNLNNRKLAILSLITKGYLKTGEPVGSKSLVSELGGSVSSATIRNDMAELERQGLVFQPHTSAGRIPTAAGLRLYVDRLMEKRRLSKQRRDFIDSLFKGNFSVEGAIAAASNALADYSQCASFSTAPSGKNITIKQIDFIKTGNHTMVFVILTQTNIVKSVFVRLDGELTDVALETLSNAVRDKLTGISLCDITPPLLQNMAAALNEYSLLFSPFFEALTDTISELLNPGVYIKGQDNLLRSVVPRLDAAKALNLLDSSKLLDLINPTSGVSIIIPESEDDLNTALIYSGYHYGDDMMGAIGILGPHRLDYSNIIPMIEYFSQSLENMIKNSELDK